jgi:hypothetical protein
MNSTKYELLKADFEFACRLLKDYTKEIRDLREENKKLKTTVEVQRYTLETVQKENDMLCNKLADIRDLFDEDDMEAEGHGMEDMVGNPFAVACYAENKLKRLIDKVYDYEKALLYYGDREGNIILKALDYRKL